MNSRKMCGFVRDLFFFSPHLSLKTAFLSTVHRILWNCYIFCEFYHGHLDPGFGRSRIPPLPPSFSNLVLLVYSLNLHNWPLSRGIMAFLGTIMALLAIMLGFSIGLLCGLKLTILALFIPFLVIGNNYLFKKRISI